MGLIWRNGTKFDFFRLLSLKCSPAIISGHRWLTKVRTSLGLAVRGAIIRCTFLVLVLVILTVLSKLQNKVTTIRYIAVGPNAFLIINPWRTCAARVTVVGLCVCLFVCLFVCQRLFSHYRLRGGL